MRVVVLSDTHAPRRWRVCPPAVAGYLRQADLILHAGDVCTASVLTELAEYAPVTAVVGNNDEPGVARGAPPGRPNSTWTACAWRWCTTAAPPPGGWRGYAAGSPSGPGGVRALPHPARRVRARPADLQPGIADGPQAPAARHARRPRDRLRPPARSQHRRRHLNAPVRSARCYSGPPARRRRSLTHRPAHCPFCPVRAHGHITVDRKPAAFPRVWVRDDGPVSHGAVLAGRL